jgi:hypothetical protein
MVRSFFLGKGSIALYLLDSGKIVTDFSCILDADLYIIAVDDAGQRFRSITFKNRLVVIPRAVLHWIV